MKGGASDDVTDDQRLPGARYRSPTYKLPPWMRNWKPRKAVQGNRERERRLRQMKRGMIAAIIGLLLSMGCASGPRRIEIDVPDAPPDRPPAEVVVGVYELPPSVPVPPLAEPKGCAWSLEEKLADLAGWVRVSLQDLHLVRASELEHHRRLEALETALEAARAAGEVPP